MSEETGKSNPNWLGLAPNLEHFDPFEGLSERVSEEELKHIRYGFRIAGQNLLFEKTVPCEAIQNSLIYPVPNTPVWLSGLINLRGNLIPVIDLSSLISAQNGDS
ncbi:MAG TPA: chemotaxis protein CheW, partial [Gammaproteobacteria bacterium]|nr:chemotaxis protein CheW [Gammaproteobacteria bacterium]